MRPRRLRSSTSRKDAKPSVGPPTQPEGTRKRPLKQPSRPRPGPPGPAGEVTAVHLRVVPESYVGTCPSPVVLTADITTNGPGVVWYRFLAGAVYRNGPAEGTVRFTAAGTKAVVLEGTIRVTPAVGQTSLIAAMEDEQGNHGPQTVTSGPVNYNRTCQK